MKQKKPPIKLALGRSHPLTLAAVMAAVIFSTITLVYVQVRTENAVGTYEAMRQQAAVLSAQNQQLSDRIASLDTVESAMQIAQEKLGLVDPDAVVVDPGN